jgi:bifunctional UDP-N-acetylglucosamine pyrophosphorylase / glucosamine-1-phosphate N-acetyltransferase
MMMKKYAALILAAGKGTRMKSARCKVLHQIAGLPMISYVLRALDGCALEKTVVVVGHQPDSVKSVVACEKAEFALQEPQLGTGHAAAAARNCFSGYAGEVLILCGDIPLIRQQTLQDFMRYHEEHHSTLTVLTSVVDDPYGYGRILRGPDGRVIAIVEERDASPAEKAVKEINTGVYLVGAGALFSLLDRIGSENAQGEYYLTDIVGEAVSQSLAVNGFVLPDPAEALGVNTRADLARVASIVWDQRRTQLMDAGVTLLDPASVYVDADVTVGPDSVIHPGVTLSGATEIGRECVVESGVYIISSRLGDRVKVLQGCRLDRVSVDDDTSVGPMAHLRPETKIGKNARIGNFVEVKKTVVGDGTKAAHLTYLGDSWIGKDVNIGCGTITCNYDGKHKHPTTIHDRCFVGSDVQFVAPVDIGEGSVIGAGSTITRNVPPKMLAVSRTPQKLYPLRALPGQKPVHEESPSGHDSDGNSQA